MSCSSWWYRQQYAGAKDGLAWETAPSRTIIVDDKDDDGEICHFHVCLSVCLSVCLINHNHNHSHNKNENPTRYHNNNNHHQSTMGVTKEIRTAGDGTTFPKQGDMLTMHYTGTLASDGSQFDSSVTRGEPFQFVIGIG